MTRARIGNASGADLPCAVRKRKHACVANPNVLAFAPFRDVIAVESALSLSRAPLVFHCLQAATQKQPSQPARGQARQERQNLGRQPAGFRFRGADSVARLASSVLVLAGTIQPSVSPAGSRLSFRPL